MPQIIVLAWNVPRAALQALSRSLGTRRVRVHALDGAVMPSRLPAVDAGGRVLLIGSPGHRPGPVYDAIARLREHELSLPVILCAAPGEPALRHLPEYVLAGIDELVLLNAAGDARELARLVAGYGEHNLREDCLARLLVRAGPLRGEMTWIARRSFRPFDVESVAAWFGVDPSTLRRRHHHGPISLHDWMCVCRLLHVAHELDWSVLSISAIAHRQGFPSPSNMSTFVMRRMGPGPRRLRELGAVRCVVEYAEALVRARR